jgi:hypothetical protein
MKNRNQDIAIVGLSCLLLGFIADFGFNGVILGYVSQTMFTEKFAYIYCTLFFSIAYGLSNYLPETRFHKFSYFGVAAFLVGTLISHLSFVGSHSIRLYIMEPDLKYTATEKAILFRSATWQQVLFVTSDNVQKSMSERFNNEHVPVVIEVTSDYGCDRETYISTVAGVDVRTDHAANWVWQVDRKMAVIEPGPNTEDHHYFWCRRKPKIKEFEGVLPGTRPWEEHPEGKVDNIKSQ